MEECQQIARNAEVIRGHLDDLAWRTINLLQILNRLNIFIPEECQNEILGETTEYRKNDAFYKLVMKKVTDANAKNLTGVLRSTGNKDLADLFEQSDTWPLALATEQVSTESSDTDTEDHYNISTETELSGGDVQPCIRIHINRSGVIEDNITGITTTAADPKWAPAQVIFWLVVILVFGGIAIGTVVWSENRLQPTDTNTTHIDSNETATRSTQDSGANDDKPIVPTRLPNLVPRETSGHQNSIKHLLVFVIDSKDNFPSSNCSLLPRMHLIIESPSLFEYLDLTVPCSEVYLWVTFKHIYNRGVFLKLCTQFTKALKLDFNGKTTEGDENPHFLPNYSLERRCEFLFS